MVTNQWHFKQVFTEPPFDTTFRWMAGPREIATDQLTNAYITGFTNAARAGRESRLLSLL